MVLALVIIKVFTRAEKKGYFYSQLICHLLALLNRFVCNVIENLHFQSPW